MREKLIDKGEARQYVADILKVGRSTLYRALAIPFREATR
jgi:hypothetical protein